MALLVLLLVPGTAGVVIFVALFGAAKGCMTLCDRLLSLTSTAERITRASPAYSRLPPPWLRPPLL